MLIFLPYDFQFFIAYKLFSRYDRIQSIRVVCSNHYHQFCYIIEFEKPNSAAELLRKRHLKIDGNIYQVRAIDEIPLVDEINVNDTFLQPPPTRSSPKNIVNALNDDCLYEIFQNIDHLGDFDSILNVCTRFRKIALQVFPSKIRTRFIDIDDLIIDNGIQFNCITLAQLWRFFYDFGSSITSLKFHSVYLERTPNASNLAIKMIEKYCKNIRCLDIEINTEQDQIPIEIYSIFSKLQVLSIKFPQQIPSHDFISACRKLEDLSVYTRQGEFSMSAIAFPNLVKLKVYRAVFGPDFFEQNPQIEELEMHDVSWPNNTIRFICLNMVNLKKFKLYAKSGSQLQDLHHIDHVPIHLDGIHVDADIRPIFRFQNITQITLHEFAEWDLIEFAQHLRNLEKIKIKPQELIPSAAIKEVLQHANKLTQFHQYGEFAIEFNERDYYRILGPILSRKGHIKLTVTYECIYSDRNDLPEERLHQQMRIWNEHPDLFVFIYT